MSNNGPLLYLQQVARLHSAGRLRMGTSTPGKNGGKRPLKSSTWVLTSANRELIEHAASLYGGTAEQWQKTDKEREWRCITQTDTLPVYVLPFRPFQALERFNDKRRLIDLRCDGVTCKTRNSQGRWEQSPCQCNPAENDVPCGARLTTRINVILPEMPTIGTWMLETHGYYAAVELPAGLDFVRVQDRLVARALLRIEQRRRVDPAGGPDRLFGVPILMLENTPQHLEALDPRTVSVAALGQQAKALTAGADPLEDADWSDREFTPSTPDPEPPDTSYTEREFASVLARHDVRSSEARALLVKLRPPSLDQLEHQLQRLETCPGPKPDAKLLQLARQTGGVATWDEFILCVDELAGVLL